MNEFEQTRAWAEKILGQVERVIVGKRQAAEKMLAAILAGGHILLEDNPGLAKTLMANCLAQSLGLGFKRIQFTPDLLPGDIIGGYVFNRAENRFELRRGPLFTNIVLADEINRASPKTQSALLEAMQEGQLSIEGETFILPEPFVVIATQNPIEYEGTFPLPEAQLDRFMVRLSLGYPSREEEVEVLRRRKDRQTERVGLDAVVGAEDVLAMRQAAEKVRLDEALAGYIVDLAAHTRADARAAVGASPRGALALMRLAGGLAALRGRGFILPDDIKELAGPALAHRLMLTADLWLRPDAAFSVVRAALEATAVPVLE